MTGKIRLAMVFVALVLFSVNAFADLSVSIAPKNPAFGVMGLYPNEVGEFEVRVANNGAETVEKVTLKFSVDESLDIFREENAVKALAESISMLAPGESELLFIKVRPRELTQADQYVYVNYGEENFTHLVATYVKVLESPLEVQARLEKSALDMGEGSKLSLKLSNAGEAQLNNIGAEMLFPLGVYGKSPPVVVSMLSSGERVERQFVFEVDPGFVGEKKLVLLVSFEDSKGRHVLERDFVVDVQDRKTVIYFLVAAIIILVVVALYLKRKPLEEKKVLETPELKDVEGKEIKEVESEDKAILK